MATGCRGGGKDLLILNPAPCCSGRLQISKTSCSISGPTSTTIARIPHWKGERRIRRCHDQSQISARFDGNRTVVTHIRHQWLRNFPKTLDRCVSGQPWGNLQLNHLVFAFLVAARFADPIVSLPPYQFARDRYSWRCLKSGESENRNHKRSGRARYVCAACGS